MKLSSKARYGLKAMCYLAEHYGEGAKSLNAMAASTQLSEKYLEQLLAILRKAELVESTRGASGGYTLSRSPEQISAGEVLRAVEDGLVIVDCLSGQCDNRQGCTTYHVWNKLYQAINRCLDDMSLASLVEVAEETV